eukprot:Platyproteum_vivax@DN17071_c0_g1_i1.p1
MGTKRPHDSIISESTICSVFFGAKREKREYSVEKLSEMSPVFRSMLESPLKEGLTKEVELPEDDSDTFEAMYVIQEIRPLISKTGIDNRKMRIQMNFGFCFVENTLEHAADILEMAHKYEVTQVADFVKERFERGDILRMLVSYDLESISRINRITKIKWPEGFLSSLYELYQFEATELIKLLPEFEASCSIY